MSWNIVYMHSIRCNMMGAACTHTGLHTYALECIQADKQIRAHTMVIRDLRHSITQTNTRYLRATYIHARNSCFPFLPSVVKATATSRCSPTMRDVYGERPSDFPPALSSLRIWIAHSKSSPEFSVRFSLGNVCMYVCISCAWIYAIACTRAHKTRVVCAICAYIHMHKFMCL